MRHKGAHWVICVLCRREFETVRSSVIEQPYPSTAKVPCWPLFSTCLTTYLRPYACIAFWVPQGIQKSYIWVPWLEVHFPAGCSAPAPTNRNYGSISAPTCCKWLLVMFWPALLRLWALIPVPLPSSDIWVISGCCWASSARYELQLLSANHWASSHILRDALDSGILQFPLIFVERDLPFPVLACFISRFPLHMEVAWVWMLHYHCCYYYCLLWNVLESLSCLVGSTMRCSLVLYTLHAAHSTKTNFQECIHWHFVPAVVGVLSSFFFIPRRVTRFVS